MADGAVIPHDRTAVPVEYDDFRKQLERLTETLQPTEPGGVSPLGAVINTAADNLRGQGANIRDTIIKLSQAFSALGDHSTDIFATVKNLSTLVSALQDSTDLMRQLNGNLASVTGLLANDPDEVANAVSDLNTVVGDVQSFVADNREALGTTSDKLAGVTQALTDSLDDVKQTLHVAPNTLQNYVNIYEPANGAVTGVLDDQQLRQPDHLHLRRGSGGVPVGHRAVGEALRAIPGADHQEPAVQLPAVGSELLRRCHGPAERNHLQRGLDAAGLRSAAGAARLHRSPLGASQQPHRPVLRWRPRLRRWPPTPPTD